jgi:hypothetical protein
MILGNVKAIGKVKKIHKYIFRKRKYSNSESIFYENSNLGRRLGPF